MSHPKFDINGIKVTARPIGGGWYMGIPDNLGECLSAILTGKISIDSLLTGRGLTVTPVIETPAPAPTPAPQPTQPKGETIRQYRERTGMSRTRLADMLGMSRRSLGRWEAKGRYMSEV